MNALQLIELSSDIVWHYLMSLNCQYPCSNCLYISVFFSLPSVVYWTGTVSDPQACSLDFHLHFSRHMTSHWPSSSLFCCQFPWMSAVGLQLVTTRILKVITFFLHSMGLGKTILKKKTMRGFTFFLDSAYWILQPSQVLGLHGANKHLGESEAATIASEEFMCITLPN